MTAQSTVRSARTLNQVVGWITGLAFIVVGVLGFTVSGGHDAAGHEGGKLLGLFEVNVLHNLVHLAVGAALILAAMASVKASRTVNSVIGVVYLVVGVAGLFILDSSANILALNGSDNALHVVSGAALLAVGMWGRDR